ncbi:MAG: radical SAM protein [Bacteroidales bacterium]|nr:radical SAM protein [Bacteroidales bacterium]
MCSVKNENAYDNEDITLLKECVLCPRECRVNRFEGGTGYCGADAGMNIASICVHKGEEPSISGKDGICNIFFRGCNLRCVYCQNYEISRPGTECGQQGMTITEVLDTVEQILSTGIKAVGFVSPSHVVPQVKAIIYGLNKRGLKPITVYNTNSYDKPATLRSIADMINVYLPDFKYASPENSKEFSDVPDYPEVAFRAIREMYYQKGSTLTVGDSGLAENGIILRHLVLPGNVEESKKVLKMIAEELSAGIHLSLMSQYHPTLLVKDHSLLKRSLYRAEYEAVVETMNDLGFRNGWVQDMDSNLNYNPDFSRENPFE